MANALSGQRSVPAAGTATPLGDIQVNAPLIVKALKDNTAYVYVGNDGNGDVSAANGFQLGAGETIVFEWVGNLGSIWVDAAVDGEGVCWAALDV